MSLTAEELAMVQGSLDRIRDDFDAYSTLFYDALFRHAPKLRSLFREDLAGQGMKFMSTLDVIVQKLGDEDALASQYTGLGHTHSSLGVRIEDFQPMEEALMETLRNALGDDFTNDLERAWRKAYGVVSANMIRRGRIGEG